MISNYAPVRTPFSGPHSFGVELVGKPMTGNIWKNLT